MKFLLRILNIVIILISLEYAGLAAYLSSEQERAQEERDQEARRAVLAAQEAREQQELQQIDQAALRYIRLYDKNTRHLFNDGIDKGFLDEQFYSTEYLSSVSPDRRRSYYNIVKEYDASFRRMLENRDKSFSSIETFEAFLMSVPGYNNNYGGHIMRFGSHMIDEGIVKISSPQAAVSEGRTRSTQASAPVSTPAVASHSQVAVLPPVNWPVENIAIAALTSYAALSPDEARTLTDKLRNILVETGYFRIVSREDMATILKEQQFQRTDVCDSTACLVEMGKVLSVQKIVGGSIGKVGRTFNLSLRLVNVETGQTELAADKPLQGVSDQLLALIDITGKELALRYAKMKQGK